MANPLYDALFAPHLGSDRVFLVDADGSDAISYGQFLNLSSQLAHALSDLGLAPGDRLVAQVQKSPMALGLYVACVMAGVVYLPLNSAYTAQEVHYFLGDSGARVLVCDPARKAMLASTTEELGAVALTMDADGSGSLHDLAKGQATTFGAVDRTLEDLAALLYTSGTTGRSKGAMLSHRNLLSNAETLAHEWRFTCYDVLLHGLPIFHTHGLFVATNISLLTGGAMIFLPTFDAGTVIDALPRATAMMGVPTFYTRLLADPRFNRELVAHMRLFTSGSAPLLTETHENFQARTGHRILERYGMTETNMNTSNPYDGLRKAGTVGKALPGIELKITDPETGATLPDGEIGVIEIRGPNVFSGYWQMPEKTAQELRSDGFFITGDLALIDEDGYVVIVGRGKDLVISGAYNIYPKEVELVLDEMPGVLESAVIGVPHPDFGEGVVGVLVPRDGAVLDKAAILAAAGKTLAKFKLPKRLVVVDALPRNTMGKVQKNALRDLFAESFK